MASNYTGDPTAAESPSPAPSPGALPIVSLPADGDSLDAASVEQAFKTAADNCAFGNVMAQRVSSDFYFEDDFFGSALNTGLWNSAPTGLAFNDGTNSIAEAMGYAKLSAASASRDLNTPSGGGLFSTVDFRFCAKVKTPTMTTAGAVVHIGLEDSGGILKYGFEAVKGSNGDRWYATSNGSRHDSGVAWGSSYQRLEIKRTSGHFYFLIDEVAVYDEAVVSNDLVIISFLVEDLSATSTAYIDYVKMWAARTGGL